MRNKSIQNTNVYKQIQKCKERVTDRQTDRQTDRHMLRKLYSNLLGKENSTIYITVRNHTIHIVVSISANCKYIFNLEPNCLTEQ